MTGLSRAAERVGAPLPRALKHAWAMRRPLDELALELTRYCNLTCEMCSVWEERKHGVSLEHAKRLLDDAHALGARTFLPFGAEQFMRKDFLDIVAHACALDFGVSITSNGAMITQAHLDRLATMPTVGVTISIDGPRAVHDTLRGSGVYDKAVATVRELVRRRIRVGIAAVVMRETLGSLTHLIDLAAELGVPAVSYQPFQTEISGDARALPRFLLGPADRAELEARLAELEALARHREIRLATAAIFPYIAPYLLDGVRPIPPGGCEIPARSLVIKRNGDVFPCYFMLDRAIGNVHQSTLSELWHNDAQRELNRLALAEQCPGCLAACSDMPTYRSRAPARAPSEPR